MKGSDYKADGLRGGEKSSRGGGVKKQQVSQRNHIYSQNGLLKQEIRTIYAG